MKSLIRPPADDVFVELVELLFAPIAPVLIIGLTLAGLGFLVQWSGSSDCIRALAAAGLAVALGRAALMLSFRNRKGSLKAVDCARWEKRYAIGGYLFAMILGTFNLVAMQLGDDLAPMLVAGLIFGYGSGLAARAYFRPAICMINLALAGIPTILAFLLRVHGQDQASVAFGAEGIFLVIFFLACFETVHFSYQTTLRQLTAKRLLTNLARLDPLTGLPNRTFLQERFDHEVSSLDANDLIALHYLDLDGFKQVNDRFGHPTGDTLLVAVSMRLKRAIRDDDTAIRLGGDEFVVVQPRVASLETAHAAAERFMLAISAPYEIDGRLIKINTCIGVALARRHGTDLDLETLMVRADTALYSAKRKGRGGIACWADGQEEPAARAA